MVNITMFTKTSELCELTGLTREQLWDAGFNLDDWDVGLCCDQRLHRSPTQEELADPCEYYDPESLITDWDSEGHWLFSMMDNYCAGPSYTKYGEKHYYLVHHA